MEFSSVSHNLIRSLVLLLVPLLCALQRSTRASADVIIASGLVALLCMLQRIFVFNCTLSTRRKKCKDFVKNLHFL